MIPFRTGLRLVVLLAGVLSLGACGSKGPTHSSALRPNGAVRSPSGDLRLVHDAGNSGVPAAYRLFSKDGEQLGNARSIVTGSSEGTSLDSPVIQTVKWSSSEKTVIIHEDMSADYPDHSYRMMQRNSSGAYASRAIMLRPRGRIPAEWPTIESTTDSRLKLRWKSEPESEYVPLPPPQE